MRRREFITLLGSSAAAGWPLGARAQRADTPSKVGVLIPFFESDADAQSLLAIFREALAQLGWTEGSNLQIDIRWGGPDPVLLARFAAELVALGPQVLFGAGTAALEALRQQTSTIPIVFASVIDPVGQGLVQNLARPGGNITGFSSGIGFLVAGKWLGMLRQITPPVARVAVLFNPETTPSADPFIGAVKEAAQPIAVAVRTAPVHSVSEIDGAITAGLARDEPGGLVVLPSVFTVANRAAIIAAAARHRLPAIYAFPFFVRDGGLMSYGGDFADQQRRSAEYVDRILKGVGPGDLPVQQATKYVLVINLKSAKALGITIAPSLLAIADEVIE